jgi:hypothetical protein
VIRGDFAAFCKQKHAANQPTKEVFRDEPVPITNDLTVSAQPQVDDPAPTKVEPISHIESCVRSLFPVHLFNAIRSGDAPVLDATETTLDTELVMDLVTELMGNRNLTYNECVRDVAAILEAPSRPKFADFFATLQSDQEDEDVAFLAKACNEVADCIVDMSLAFVLGMLNE